MNQVSKIYSDEWSVTSRLREVFDATRQDFIPIIEEIVGAMADAVDDDPSFTAGMFGHIHGVRNTRGMFRQKGWQRLSKNGNELVKHPEKDLSVGICKSLFRKVTCQHPSAGNGDQDCTQRRNGGIYRCAHHGRTTISTIRMPIAPHRSAKVITSVMVSHIS